MLSLKKITLLLAFFSLFSTASVKAQTIIPAEDGTGTIITRDGQRITIDGGSLSQDGKNLFHSFQEFGLSPQQIANFLANPQLQNILSRVTGGNPSVIRGLIEVSGGNPNLYLMNPAGIIFGENARLNVPADFTATTATGIGFENGWFNAIGDNNYEQLVGTPNQFIFNTDNPSAIINSADLSVSEGNTLSLSGGSIANTGTLTAKEGNIIITAVPEKNLIRISQPGHLLSLEIVPPETETGEWNVSVHDLPALLTGNQSPEGLVVAEDGQTVALNNTEIPTSAGSNIVSGTLDVSGDTGGNIYVLGERVGLYEAQLSAEGVNGGGNLLIGGDYQGKGTLPNAQRTFVSEGSQLNANALARGNGGEVIVWSEEMTAFAGEILAQGGEEQGNGGFVEVSGKDALSFEGEIDVSATQGETGTILFDPRDILIVTFNPDIVEDAQEIADGEILFEDGGVETDFTLFDSTLTALEGNIILEASRDIIAQGGSSLDFSRQTLGNTITLDARRNVEVSSTVRTFGANLEVFAESGSINLRNINTNLNPNESSQGGGIILNAGGEIAVGQIFQSAIEGNSSLIINTPDNVNLGGQPNLIGVDVKIGEETPISNLETNNNLNTQGGNFFLALSQDYTLPVSINTEGGNLNLISAGNLDIDSVIDTNGGDITVTGVNIRSSEEVFTPLDSSNFDNDAGNITINAQGEINLGNLSAKAFFSEEGIGNGGNIDIEAVNGISISSVTANADNLTGNAGDINIESQQGDINIGSIESSPGFASSGAGGEVTVTSSQGNIETRSINTGAFSDNPGNVTLQAGGSVAISDIQTFSDNGDGGNVLIEAEGDIETINEILTFSNTGNAGNVTVQGDGSVMMNAPIAAESNSGAGGNVLVEAQNNIQVNESISTASDNGNAGTITLEAGGFIDASLADAETAEAFQLNEPLEEFTLDASSASGNGGEVALQANDNIIVGFINSASESGNGGNVTITSTGGDVNASHTLVVEGDTLTDQTEVGLILSGSQTGDGGNVGITAQGNIRTGLIGSGSLGNGTGGNISLNSETGSIDTTVGISDLEPAFLEDLGLSQALANAASTASVEIGLLFSGANEGVGGNVELTAQGDINTGMIITGTIGEAGGNVTITSNEGAVNTSFDAIVDGATEQLYLEADVDPNLAALLDGVSVRPGIITFSEEAKGGDVTINANGDIITSNITTGSFRGEGGTITLDSETGSIDGSAGRFLENVTAALIDEIDADSTLSTIAEYFSQQAIGGYLTLSIDEKAGDINLSAEGDITTNYLIGSSFSGEGGNITLDTDRGSINVEAVIFNAARGIFPGNLNTDDEDLESLAELVSGGSVNSSGTTGGEIEMGNLVEETVEKASGSITTGAINSSGRIGDGGDITLAGEEDIQVSSVNAQGGEAGSGGAIDVTTDRFFRATDAFFDQNEILASISSLGGEGGGEITIRHGGQGEIPFTVGEDDELINGTAADITSGEFGINDGLFFFTEQRGNISIISVPEPDDNGEPEVADEPNPEVLQKEPIRQTTLVNPQPPLQIVTIDQAQAVLQDIDRASGIKPALIYVNFVPQTLSGITDFQRQEALSTQAYEEYFNLPQRKADVTLSVPRQGDDQLELLLVTQGGDPYQVTVEGATREQVEATTQTLYELISSPPTPISLQLKPYLQPAEQLYDWIIEPLAAQLSEQEIENLVFVMPAGLRLLPIAALYDGEQFLVENYSTGFSPSLSLTDTRYKNLQDLEVFAAGASNFSDPTALGPLPAVELELPTIANELWRGEFELNEQFTLENFRQERRRDPRGIIHLATHADFRSGNPEEIYVQFYDDKIRLDEIRQLDLNEPPVELLVLSACRTAVGDERVELGFAGLAVQAGVKSALASLWYVGDTGTLALMSEFYRQLNTAPIKAEAMREAQVGMISGEVRLEGTEIITPRGELALPSDLTIRAEDLSHPYYWSAFTMVGSPW